MEMMRELLSLVFQIQDLCPVGPMSLCAWEESRTCYVRGRMMCYSALTGEMGLWSKTMD